MRALILIALAAAVVGCGNRNDSVVVVTLSSDAPLDGISQVRGTASAGGRDVQFTIAPSKDGAVATPLSLGIEVPHDISGTITVHCDVYDAGGAILGSGDGSTHIVPGGRSDLAITLTLTGAAGADLGSSGDVDMGRQPPIDMTPPPPDLEIAAQLAIDTALQSFGPATQGHVSATAQFTITNSGTIATSMPVLTTSGDTADFDISTDCGASVAAFGRCHVTVDFAPKTNTPATAKDLKFTLAATTGGSVMGEATGTSLTPGQLSISPGTGSCGAALVGVQSATQASFTVHNGGSTATGALSVTLGDTNQFSSSGCSGSTLAAGANCTLTITFTPKKRGSSACSILVSDTPSDQATASVNGTGQVAAMVAVSPPSYPFPGGPRGSPAQTQAFTVSNSGDLPTATLQPSSTTNGAFVVTADSCQGKALGGTPCSVSVQFTPPVTGTTSGTLQIKDATSTLATSSLTGTGTPIWVREYSGTAMANLNAVWVTSDGKYAFAGGEQDVMIGRAGNGVWSTQNILDIAAGAVTAISGSSATDLWATHAGQVLRSTGDGNWTYKTTATPTGVTSADDLFVIGPGDVWVAGRTQTGGIGHYTYASYQYLPGTNSWAAGEPNSGCARLWGASDTALFCAYNHINSSSLQSGLNLRTSGTPWSVDYNFFAAPIATANFTARVWGTSPTDVYVAITDNSNFLQRPRHYNGSGAPSAVDISAHTGVAAVWAPNGTSVFFGGTFGVQSGDGSTWNTPVDPLGKSLSVLDIHGTSANDFYAVGQDADGMCVYHWF